VKFLPLKTAKSLTLGLIFGLAACANLQSAEIIGKPSLTGDEPRVDNWVDVWMLAQQGPAGKPLQATGKFGPRYEILDTTNAKNGLFSVRFVARANSGEQAFGLYVGPYLAKWDLSKDFVLRAWVKAAASQATKEWRMVLYDTEGRMAGAAVPKMKANGEWCDINIPLNSLNAEEGFDFGAIRSVQVETALTEGADLWLDDVRFERGDEILGISDKTITQYMAEAASTRPQRVEETLSDPRAWHVFKLISPLYKGEDLEATNESIIEWTKTIDEGPNGNWTLMANSTANWLLLGFGSKGRIAPNRLTPEAERVLLDYYWKHCELKNDIATARHSTWWVTGSENHDINFKMGNLLSSQIFMHEPDYRDRIYPDLGRMQGYGYGGGGTFRAGKVPPKEKLGGGNYKDGKKYNAADHYQAWVSFWKEFLAERARHGFFIEHNAAGYMLHTQRFLHEIYAWSDDAELRKQARMFMDLVWAQWAQDQILGITGGACSRGEAGYSRMSGMSAFFLGGPTGDAVAYAFSDYQWPREVWETVLGRRQMGEYAFVSRKPNEAQDLWPQPPGTEYTMIVRPDSRLVRYSWATPDYVLGTRMDHPDALYHHLGGASAGLTFATTPDATINWLAGGPYVAVQDRGVALVQAKKSIRFQHPAWFPGYTWTPMALTIPFGLDIDVIEEQDGWVFVQEGNAYAAFRIVYPAEETIQEGAKKGRLMAVPIGFDEDGFGLFSPEPAPYTWMAPDPNKPKIIQAQTARTIEAKAEYAALIVEVSRKPHHASLEAFKKDVLDNPLKLKQVIAGRYILTYKGCGPEAKELELNCANQQSPKIGGEVLTYDCPTFDSPWLQGATGSGVITLTGPLSGEKLVLDFNKASPERGGDQTPVVKSHIYKTSGGEEQDMEIHFPPNHDPAKAKVPGMILFHGGGWAPGGPDALRQFRDACAYFASRGLVCATVNYRGLSNDERAKLAPGESFRRVCVTDAKSAIRWFKQHADELGVDPDRIITGGGSAGGHISAIATLSPGLDDPADPKDIDTSVVAYLWFNPAFYNPRMKFVQKEDTETDILPYVKPGLAPAIAFFGDQDPWLPGWTEAHAKWKKLGLKDIDFRIAPGQ